MDVFIMITSALGHQTAIRSLTPQPCVIATSKASSEYSYTYTGNGVSLCYEELNGPTQVIVESMPWIWRSLSLR